MLISDSCTIRNRAVSVSSGSRAKLSGSSRSTLMPLRSANPAAYHRSADSRPIRFVQMGGRPMQSSEMHLQGGQILSGGLVQHPRDPASFVVLRAHQSARECVQLALCQSDVLEVTLS